MKLELATRVPPSSAGLRKEAHLRELRITVEGQARPTSDGSRCLEALDDGDDGCLT